MVRFGRVVLRTVDVAGARGFYASILGHDRHEIVPLPARAAAHGAPPHWLGHITVPDPIATAATLQVQGAQLLSMDGPIVLRDPGGATIALSDTAVATEQTAWHHLETADLERTTAFYATAFGWRWTADRFTWREDGVPVGSVATIAGRPGVHPQWLFVFDVPSCDAAVAQTAHAGGRMLASHTLPDGRRLAVCEDPWGAAVAIRDGAHPTGSGSQ